MIVDRIVEESNEELINLKDAFQMFVKGENISQYKPKYKKNGVYGELMEKFKEMKKSYENFLNETKNVNISFLRKTCKNIFSYVNRILKVYQDNEDVEGEDSVLSKHSQGSIRITK